MQNTVSGADALAGLIVIILCLVFWFLPVIIAANRNHRNTTAIFILDLFLGWTIIGWIIALIWSVKNDR